MGRDPIRACFWPAVNNELTRLKSQVIFDPIRWDFFDPNIWKFKKLEFYGKIFKTQAAKKLTNLGQKTWPKSIIRLRMELKQPGGKRFLRVLGFEPQTLWYPARCNDRSTSGFSVNEIYIYKTDCLYVPMSLFHTQTARPISSKFCTDLHTDLGKVLI